MSKVSGKIKDAVPVVIGMGIAGFIFFAIVYLPMKHEQEKDQELVEAHKAIDKLCEGDLMMMQLFAESECKYMLGKYGQPTRQRISEGEYCFHCWEVRSSYNVQSKEYQLPMGVFRYDDSCEDGHRR